MRPMIRQPQRRVIPNKAGFPYPGVGFLMGNDPEDIFGTRRLNYFNAPELLGNTHGLARRFVAASRTYASVTPPAGLVDFTQNFTVAISFIIDEMATCRLLHYSDGSTNLILALLSSGYLVVSHGIGSGGTPNIASTVPLQVGVPYTAVFGRELTGGYFMYVNGVEQVRGTTASIANNVASTDIQIGRRSDNTSYFNGQVSLFAHIAGRPDAESLSRNPWQLFLEPPEEPVSEQARTDRTLTAGPASFAVAGGPVRMLVTRRMRAVSASMAVSGGSVAMRAARRMSAQPAALQLAGGSVDMLYRPKPVPGSYTMPATAAAFALRGGDVRMRLSRRLAVSGARLALTAGSVTLRLSEQPARIDISKIHPSRIVIFDGSGSRVTPFGGSGSRVTPFEGSGSRVTEFE